MQSASCGSSVTPVKCLLWWPRASLCMLWDLPAAAGAGDGSSVRTKCYRLGACYRCSQVPVHMGLVCHVSLHVGDEQGCIHWHQVERVFG
jgi:hypothetical protein